MVVQATLYNWYLFILKPIINVMDLRHLNYGIKIVLAKENLIYHENIILIYTILNAMLFHM
jgi:hypothetical protein